ncbi:GAF domain-containing protein [Haloarcula pelagica]|uniref:GAF domain-containing protein n=1 Tax=Haloarcula pelagica TaxID=3033389 RepID=UPI0024C350A6|nr:GAF domain-containing protein [Halomicroarcula sp. YJ-61-S]
MSEVSPAVICADPDESEQSVTVDALADAGYEVDAVTTVSDIEQAVHEWTDCVVTAAAFPDGDAFDVVEAVRGVNPDCVCILFTDTSPSDLPRGRPEQVVEYVPRTVRNARERLVDIVGSTLGGAGQAAYPVPKDEGARIAAVREYDIDELRAADAFDRVTELVVSHFDIDVAFVGLVDAHEEQFVACEGANWSTLSREDTVCTHTVLTDEVMVVEDTHEDPRFAANDRLDELDIRSYAGARITDADGNALGAVCCIDGEPRSYSHTERADLRRFADEVEEQLRLRKRLSGEEM